MTELCRACLFASRLNLQAHRSAMLHAGFPGLEWNPLSNISYSICAESINRCHDGRIGVLVGVGQPGVLTHA